MKEIPDFAIPIILSFLEVKEIGQCICLGRVWASCVQYEHIASKLAPSLARAKVMIPFTAFRSYFFNGVAYTSLCNLTVRRTYKETSISPIYCKCASK